MSTKPRAKIRDIETTPITHTSPLQAGLEQTPGAQASTRSGKPGGGKSESIGVWYPAGALDLARRAYAADLQEYGTPSSYTAWVEAAVLEHARRTVKQRQALTGKLEDITQTLDDLTGAPGPRQLRATVQLRNLVEEVHAQDRKDGLLVSKSQWVSDAIGAAVARTLTRTSGSLAPVVGRLP